MMSVGENVASEVRRSRLARAAMWTLAAALIAPGVASAACDDAALGRQLAAEWGPRVRNAQGTCNVARAQEGMLRAARAMYAQCLEPGTQLRSQALAEMDNKIRLAQQTQRDVGCR